MSSPGSLPVRGKSKDASGVSFAALPLAEEGTEQMVLRRKASKSKWHRTMTRTISLPTPEEVESPEFMWEKYLKFFSSDQLNWLSTEFEQSDKEKAERIKIVDAKDIAMKFINENHVISEEIFLAEETIEDLLIQVSTGIQSTLTFEHCVFFVSLYEKKLLELDPRAGYNDEAMPHLKEAFSRYAVKSPQTGKDALSTVDTFEVLAALGFDLKWKQQKEVVELIKSVDVDDSGDIDLQEFLQLFRKVQLLDAAHIRHEEHLAFQESAFSDEEFQSFQELYHYYSTEEGDFTLVQLRELFDNLGLDMDRSQKTQLVEFMKKALENQGNNLEDCPVSEASLCFPGFLLLLRQLMDMNFAGLMHACNKIVKELAHDQDALSPEELEARRKNSVEGALEQGPQAPSWVKRMIDRKLRAKGRANR